MRFLKWKPKPSETQIKHPEVGIRLSCLKMAVGTVRCVKGAAGSECFANIATSLTHLSQTFKIFCTW